MGGLLGRTRRRLALSGTAALMGWGGGALAAAAWAVGGPEAPSASVAWGLGLSLLALVLVLLVVRLVLPLRAVAGTRDLVRRLERRRSRGNLLVAAEESLRRPERWDRESAVGSELRRRVREQAATRLAGIDPDEVATAPWRRRNFAAAALAAAALAGLAVQTPDQLRTGFDRLTRPWAAQPALPTAGIVTLAGEPWVVAGADIALQALDLAGGPGSAVAEVRRGEGLWQPLEARLDRDSRLAPGRVWRARLDDVREDFAWRFRRGSIVSPERRVVVRDHPLLADLGAVITPPAYTRGEPRTLERLPAWIEVPAGSRVGLRGRASNELDAAWLVAGDDTTALHIDGRGVSGELTVVHDRVFRVGLEDTWGLRNTAPLRYEIAAAPDQTPAVALERPDDDGLLPLEGELVLVLDAADDYGLAELRLLGRVGGRGEWAGGPLRSDQPGTWSEHPVGDGILRARVALLDGHAPPLRARIRIELQVGELRLVPGDVCELVAEAADNRRPGPPGVGRSRVLRFQAPSPSEVLARQDEAQQERQSELVEARRRSRELDTDLDRLTRELMKNPVPDWGRQQEMEEAVRRQAALQDELSRIADQLQQELEDLASSQLTSQEQLERADEVAALLGERTDRELAELLRRLEEGGDQVDPRELAQSLHDATRAQKDMARRLDAALAMMERMAREQELEGMTALLEQMLRQQQELADLSRELAQQQQAQSQDGEQDEPQDGEQGEPQDGEQGEPQDGEQGEPQDDQQGKPQDPATPDAEELARRQEALARELEELHERLAAAVQEMQRKQEEGQESPAAEQSRQAMEQALADLEQSLKEGKMDEASEQLAQMDPQTAAQLQQQAMRDLGSLYHVMLETQQAMQAAMQMNQVTSLRRLAADLLAMSARQEGIADQVPVRLRDVRTVELTRRQHRLQKATIGVRDQLAELMDEAPQRIMKLLDKLDEVIEEMGEGVRALEDGQATVAQRHTRESLARTNRMVIGLLTEANMNMQGSGGGSSSSPSDASEQLQQMAREQARLNGVTEELRRMLADRGISQEARAQMERLGQEQAAQAQRVSELAEAERTRPDGERLLGDVEAMGRDIETIAEELGDGLVSEETLVRQERILSRMLDARNAARRRDYSNRRESRTADELYGDPGLAVGSPDAAEQRRARLRYQPLEKAPLEYRDLVRRYFAGVDSLRRLDPPAGRGADRGDLP